MSANSSETGKTLCSRATLILGRPSQAGVPAAASAAQHSSLSDYSDYSSDEEGPRGVGNTGGDRWAAESGAGDSGFEPLNDHQPVSSEAALH